MKNYSWIQWLDTFAYIINLWLIAFPYAVIGFLCVIFNVFLNLERNKFWAEGNVFLMFNSAYAIIQFMLTLPLIFEDRKWLRHAKFIRFISL